MSLTRLFVKTEPTWCGGTNYYYSRETILVVARVVVCCYSGWRWWTMFFFRLSLVVWRELFCSFSSHIISFGVIFHFLESISVCDLSQQACCSTMHSCFFLCTMMVSRTQHMAARRMERREWLWHLDSHPNSSKICTRQSWNCCRARIKMRLTQCLVHWLVCRTFHHSRTSQPSTKVAAQQVHGHLSCFTDFSTHDTHLWSEHFLDLGSPCSGSVMMKVCRWKTMPRMWACF